MRQQKSVVVKCAMKREAYERCCEVGYETQKCLIKCVVLQLRLLYGPVVCVRDAPNCAHWTCCFKIYNIAFVTKSAQAAEKILPGDSLRVCSCVSVDVLYTVNLLRHKRIVCVKTRKSLIVIKRVTGKLVVLLLVLLRSVWQGRSLSSLFR